MTDNKTDMPIVFCKTRHVYDSYTDFWKLVELSGYPTIYVDEMKMSEHAIYITAPMNGDYRAHLSNHIDEERNCHIVLWLLERPGSADGGVPNFSKQNRELMAQRFVDEVWVSDRRLSQETSFRYVTLGSNYGLGQPGNINAKHYDFCHMSYETPRRQTIYKNFMNVGKNGWGEFRHSVLQQSRFAVNVHQDQFPFCEPLRLALFAAYGLPVISESIYDSYPYYDTIIVDTYDDLVQTIGHHITMPYRKYYDLGQKFRDRLCVEFEFKKCIDEAIYIQGLHWR